MQIKRLDSVIKANKKCYLQTFLEGCKYVQEKIKTILMKIQKKVNLDSDSNDETESNIDNDEYHK